MSFSPYNFRFRTSSGSVPSSPMDTPEHIGISAANLWPPSVFDGEVVFDVGTTASTKAALATQSVNASQQSAPPSYSCAVAWPEPRRSEAAYRNSSPGGHSSPQTSLGKSGTWASSPPAARLGQRRV
eukprot:4958289-Prymnesium_polylepis.2